MGPGGLALTVALTLGAAEDPAEEEKPASDSATLTPPEYVGPATPYEDADTLRQLTRVDELLGRDEPLLAFDMLDEIASSAPEGVASSDGILYLPIRAAIIRRFRSLPPELLELYRRHYDPPARTAVATAVEAMSIDALERLGERYALTASGPDAFESAGDLAWDRGEAWRAATDWSRAADLNGDAARRGRLEAKIAIALLRDGARDRALARIERLSREMPDLEIPLAGERIRAKDLANHRIFGSVPTASPPAVCWPCAGGGPGRGSYAGSSSGELGWRTDWIRRFENPSSSIRDVIEEAAGSATAAEALGGPHARMVRFPALAGATDGRMVFLRTKDKVQAADLRTGKLKWQSTDDIPSLGSRTGYPAGSPYQWLLERCNPSGGQEVTYDGENVYAVEASANLASPYSRRQTALPSNTLYAFDASSGRKIWTIQIPDPKADGGGIVVLAPPVPTAVGDPRRILIAPGASREAPELVGVSPDGKLLWHRPLFGFDTVSRGRYGYYLLPGPGVAADESVAVAVYSCGAAAAVRPRDGALLWISRYRSHLRGGTSSGNDWRFVPGPPALVSGPTGELLAIIAANDSDVVTALRAETGEIVWEQAIASGGWVLIGADRERVFLAGAGAMALAIADGSPVWSAPEVGPVSGRGFVAADGLILPLRGAMARLDRETGKVLEELTFRDPYFVSGDAVWPDRPPVLVPGNLIDAGDRLVAFAPWGVAGIEPAAGTIEQEEGLDRVRALAATGRFREALDTASALLKDPEPRDRSAVRAEIVRTAIEAAQRSGDPTFLEGAGALADSREGRTAIALEQAALLARTAPAAAAAILAAAADDRARASAELIDGRSITIGPWAGAWLRDMIAGGKIEPIAEAEDAMAKVLAVSPPDARALASALLAYPYATRAPEAAAHLARLSLEARRGERAAAYWEEAARDPRAAAAGEALEALAKLLPPDAARILLLEYAARNEASRAALVEKLLGEIPDPAVALPEKPALRFWKKIEGASFVRGLDVELPGIVVRDGDKLLVLGPDGETRSETVLRNWPDLSGIPADALQYFHDEEALRRSSDGWCLVTSAGIYGLTEDGGGFQPGERWIRSLEHPLLAAVRPGMQAAQIANLARSRTVNPPLSYLVEDGLFVHVGAEALRIDPSNGKIREGPLPVPDPPGQLVDRGSPWMGSLFIATPERPMRVDLALSPPRPLSRLQPWREGEKTERLSPGRPGIVLVCETDRRVVARDLVRDREIWSEGGAGLRPWVGWSEPDRTWLFWPTGWIGCIETETGRTLWKKPFDEGYLARTAWRIPGGIVFALSRTRPSPALRNVYPWIADLEFLAMDLDGQVLWRASIVTGRAAFDPDCLLRGSKSWWIAYHSIDTGDAWSLQVLRLDPKTGEREVIFQRPQESKGGERPPVLVPVRGGIAVANPDGFGLLADPPDVVE
ncbi:MAG: PQQ-binding-like beta-propeller repeat protein [Planctomycetes bacterium]|nr:PQQ-binding-like beta-propeller repeat protein [Planctomycetota bacterium]